MAAINEQFKSLKKGALIYISLDEGTPDEEKTFILAEFINLYYHKTAHGWYVKMLIVDSFDKWKVKVSGGVVHYGIHTITKMVEAPPEEYILYKLEEEGNGELCTEATG